MEIFVLSFVVFILSGMGLALPALFRRKWSATDLRDRSHSGELGICGRSCLCVADGRRGRDPDSTLPER